MTDKMFRRAPKVGPGEQNAAVFCGRVKAGYAVIVLVFV